MNNKIQSPESESPLPREFVIGEYAMHKLTGEAVLVIELDEISTMHRNKSKNMYVIRTKTYKEVSVFELELSKLDQEDYE